MAVKPSASARRVVQVLNFLVSHRSQRFSLSELARRLEIDKTTCQSVLLALAEAAYVERDERTKTYALGPAAVALGHAALDRFGVVELARPWMEALSRELGLECLAATASGTDIVVLASTGPSSPFAATIRVGQRLPLVPPLGTPYVAWSGDAAVDDWIRRAGADGDDAELARYRAAVAAVRARGYSVTLDDDVRRRLGETVERLAEYPASTELQLERDRLIHELQHEEYDLLELTASRSYPVSQISAPVFGPDGVPVLVIGVVGFPHQLDARRIPALAGRLLETTAAISKPMGGGVAVPAGA